MIDMLSMPGKNAWFWLLRWLLLAAGIGAVPTLAFALLLGTRQLHFLLLDGAMGAIFSVVIWGGYETSHGWLERHPSSFTPVQAALLLAGKWALLYLPLFLLGALLGKVLLGVNCLQDRLSAFLTFFVGLIISSQAVNVHANITTITTLRMLEQARAQAMLLTLKAQLSPHTLFNALNLIAALIPEDPAAAEAAVLRLAGLLRKVLGGLEKEAWSLAEEFQVMEDLLELQRARFGERLRYELALPDGEAGRQVPPLVLLPLVENSLKHGFQAKVGPCWIRVQAGRGVVKVLDDGLGMRGARVEGIGLRTVRQRVEAAGGRLVWPPVASGCEVEVHLCP